SRHRRRARAPTRHRGPRPGLGLMRGALTWIVGGAVAVLLIVAVADGVRSRADASGSEAAPPRALRGVMVTADSACQTRAYRLPSIALEPAPHPPDVHRLLWRQ